MGVPKQSQALGRRVQGTLQHQLPNHFSRETSLLSAAHSLLFPCPLLSSVLEVSVRSTLWAPSTVLSPGWLFKEPVPAQQFPLASGPLLWFPWWWLSTGIRHCSHIKVCAGCSPLQPIGEQQVYGGAWRCNLMVEVVAGVVRGGAEPFFPSSLSSLRSPLPSSPLFDHSSPQ